MTQAEKRLRSRASDRGPEPGLTVLHTDGFVRSYFAGDWRLGASVLTESSAQRSAFVLGDGPPLSPGEFSDRLRRAVHWGGDEPGRRALQAGKRELQARRVSVWLPDENRWSQGVVYEQDGDTIKVGFDDGDDAAFDTRRSQWKLDKNQVIIQDDKIATSVDYDLATGCKDTVHAFVKTSCPPRNVKMHVGNHCIVVDTAPDDKHGRKQNFVFLFPYKLDPCRADAVIDHDGDVRVSATVFQV